MLASLQIRNNLDKVFEGSLSEEINLNAILEIIKSNEINYILSFGLITQRNIFLTTKDYKFRDKIYAALENKLEQVEISDLPLLLHFIPSGFN